MNAMYEEWKRQTAEKFANYKASIRLSDLELHDELGKANEAVPAGEVETKATSSWWAFGLGAVFGVLMVVAFSSAAVSAAPDPRVAAQAGEIAELLSLADLEAAALV